jgi:hypothetical protein
MIKFTDAEPAKSRERAPKAGNKDTEKLAATSDTAVVDKPDSGARKTMTPKRKKNGAG